MARKRGQVRRGDVWFSVSVYFAAFALVIWLTFAALPGYGGTWRATWETSPAGPPTGSKIGSYQSPPVTIVKGTLRYRIRIALGGTKLRLRFSNEYGGAPLRLAASSVGVASKALDARPESLRQLTFGGDPAITIPAGAPALTDPVDMVVAPLSDLIVNVYTPDGVPVEVCDAGHSRPDQARTDAADATGVAHLPAAGCLSMRPIVSEIDVLSHPSHKTIVAFGDSITDGSVDPESGERGWPGALARRLADAEISVVNAGIGGNRLLQTLPMFGDAALSRLDRDVFSVMGLSHLVVLEGTNDIGLGGPGGPLGDAPPVSAQELIAAYSQIVARAHARGVEVLGGTLLPFEGAVYWSEEKERVRSAVNEWIRASGKFDAVIDFDAAMRDPSNPRKLLRNYDRGDHLHPNSAGFRHMAEVIDVRLFESRRGS